MNKVWSDIAWDDYLYWQSQDKKTLKKINTLIKDIDRNGYKCKGKPEPLSGNLAGFLECAYKQERQTCFQGDRRCSRDRTV